MSGPNVILIMCDQLRYDCLGFAGHPLVKTPHLDRLAERGVVFDTAYCPSPVCSPARASWLTGTYPHYHGQLANYGPTRLAPAKMAVMRPDAVTLGDVFSSCGYRCGIAGPWHLGHDHVPQHGFEEFWRVYRYQGEGRPDILFDYFDSVGVPNVYAGESGPGGAAREEDRARIKRCGLQYVQIEDPRQQRTTWTVDQGLEFLDSGDNRPYFLFLSVKDPHPLIAVMPEWVDAYPIEDIELPATFKDDLEGRPSWLRAESGRLPDDVDEDSFREMVAHYYALVTHIDDQVGRVVQKLQALDQEEDTIIAFISDHGEMLGDHQTTTKRNFFEASSRVPCVVAWPGGLPAGHRVEAPFGGVDLAPTLLDLCGLSFANPIDGRTVAPAIASGEQPEAIPVFSEVATSDGINDRSSAPEDLAARVMVREGPWKFNWNRTDIDELYDLESDPDELRNLASHPDQADRVDHLRGLIRIMVRRTGPGHYHWCDT